jgi:hypothetical protein
MYFLKYHHPSSLLVSSYLLFIYYYYYYNYLLAVTIAFEFLHVRSITYCCLDEHFMFICLQSEFFLQKRGARNIKYQSWHCILVIIVQP